MTSVLHSFNLVLLLFIALACTVDSEIKKIPSDDGGGYKISPRAEILYVGDVKTFSATGGAGEYKFKILNQTGFGASISESGELSTGSVDQDNVVTLLCIDKNNQQAFATVRVFSTLRLNASDTQIILGKNMNFSAVGGKPPYKFTASSGVINQQTGAYKLTTGVSPVSITVKDANDKTHTVSYNVVNELIIVSTRSAMTLSQSSELNISGGIAPYELKLLSGSGSLSTSTGTTSIFTTSEAGLTTVQVTDASGTQKQVTIQTYDAPRLNVSEVSVMKSSGFSFSVVGGKSPYSYSVSNIGSSSLNIGTINSSSGLYTAGSTADESFTNDRVMTVTDALGQISTAIIHVLETLSLSVVTEDVMVGKSTQINLSGGQGVINLITSCGSIQGTTVKYFKAPDEVPNEDPTCTITATDSATAPGASVAKVKVRIYPQISLTLSRQRAPTGGSALLSVSGGVFTKGYSFSIMSGGGTLSNNNMTQAQYSVASSLNGATHAVLRVTDGASNFAEATLDLYQGLTMLPLENIVINKNTEHSFVTAGGYGNITWQLIVGSIGEITEVRGGPSSPSTAKINSSTSGTGALKATDQDGNSVQVTYQFTDDLTVFPNPIYIKRSPNSGLASYIEVFATGGVETTTTLPKYKYDVISSLGNKGYFGNQSRWYYAPKNSGSEIIRVTDKQGTIVNVPVTIYDELTVTPQSGNLTKGESLSFEVSGGVEPYTWEVTAVDGGAVIGNTGTLARGIDPYTSNPDTTGKYTVYDSSQFDLAGSRELEITVTDSVPISPNIYKLKINVSNIAAITSVSANVGSSTQSYYKSGDIIPVSVTFDKDVDVTGTPRIQLNSHASAARAHYQSGSGTKTLIFNYTVTSGESVTRLDYDSTAALTQYAGSTIKIKNTNIDADLTLPTVGGLDSLSGSRYLTIDTEAPSTPTSLTRVEPATELGTDATPTISASSLETGAKFELHNNSSCTSLVAIKNSITSATDLVTPSALTDGVYNFYARQIDVAGNSSSCSSSTVKYVLDQNQPVAISLSVADTDSGSTIYTNSTSVNLTLSASHATEMYITNTAGCGAGGQYENYTSSKTWTLSGGDGNKQVYFKVKNSIGSESSCVSSSTVTLDTVAPTSPTNITDGQYSNSLIATPNILFTHGTDSGSGVLKHEILLKNASNITLKSWGIITNNSILSSLNLNHNSQYFIELRTIDYAGNESSTVSSDGWWVDTESPTAVTVLSLGSNPGILTETPIISWTASNDVGPSGVDFYQVKILDINNNVIRDWEVHISGSSIEGLTLINSSQYYVKVRPIDRAGNMGPEVDSALWTANLSDACLSADEPALGLTCSNGSYYIGTVDGVRYFTTPGNCQDIPSAQEAGVCPGISCYPSGPFIATCNGGTDTLSKSWNDGSFNFYNIPSIESYLSAQGINNWDINLDTNSGRYNTAQISMINEPGQGGYHAAALYCDKMIFGSKSDWFLPNRRELDQLRRLGETLQTNLGIDRQNGHWYYSSTQSNHGVAWFQQFNDGMQSNGISKNSGQLVRCFRSSVEYDLIAPSAPSDIILGAVPNSITETPSISFTAGVDMQSGIKEHQVKVIRFSDGVIIKDWVAIESGSVVSNLNLTDGTQYFIKLRAIDKNNHLSSELSSSHWTVNGLDPCLNSPTPGTICLGGAIYLGSLNPGATSGIGTDHYMTTPGGCGEIPSDKIGGGTGYTAWPSSDFTPTCSGNDSLIKHWSDGSNNFYDVPGLVNYTSTFGTGEGAGNTDQNYGSENTTNIVAITIANQGGYHAAARYCDKLNWGGYQDWYLPNRFELNLIWIEKNNIPGLVDDGSYYWSSTQYNSATAWVQIFSDGYQVFYNKLNTGKVRCVRRF